MGEETLMLNCPHCRQAFPSAIRIDREAWEGMRADLRVIERCAHCGWSSAFSRTDYLFGPT
jgi:hypothetical protein